MKVIAVCIALLLAGGWAGSPARAGDGIRRLHVFDLYHGGYTPGPLVGHQTSADPNSWALYGIADGGDQNVGLIYKLAPPAPGSTHWTETRLYSYRRPGSTFIFPYGRLTFDPSGAAYGLELGGTGGGGAFRLTPPQPGQYFWNRETIQYFDGYHGPSSLAGLAISLKLAPSGEIYVLLQAAVLKLTPPAAGRGLWTETIVHRFTEAEGFQQAGELAIGPAGELYGVQGGTDATIDIPPGSVYRLTPPNGGTGEWSFDLIYRFPVVAGRKSTQPTSVIAGPSGTLFGMSYTGSPNGFGTVFRLQPPAAGQTAWTKTDLTVFYGADGDRPTGLTYFAGDTAVYGATEGRRSGGDPNLPPILGGVVFRLAPPATGNGLWKRTVLATTATPGLNYVWGQLVRDPAGRLYTAAQNGAAGAGPQRSGHGTIFEVAP